MRKNFFQKVSIRKRHTLLALKRSKAYIVFRQIGYISAVCLLLFLVIVYIVNKLSISIPFGDIMAIWVLALCFLGCAISMAVTSFIEFTQADNFKIPGTDLYYAETGENLLPIPKSHFKIESVGRLAFSIILLFIAVGVIVLAVFVTKNTFDL